VSGAPDPIGPISRPDTLIPMRTHRRPRIGQLGRVVALTVLLVATGRPGAAWAHGGTDRSGYSNYHSFVTSISPPVPGLEVHTTGVDGALELVNRSGRTVYVNGYGGEPYLRIDADGVAANLNSPATYVNGRRDANVPVPDHATSSAVPSWYRISRGVTAHWHDHRTHWMGSVPPDAVQASPGTRQVIFPAWTVPLVVDGQNVTVTGRLEWVPAPHHTAWLLVSLLGFLVAVGLLQISRWARRVGLGLVCLGAAAALVVAISRSGVGRLDALHRLLCFLPVVAVTLPAAAALRRRDREFPLVWGLAGISLVVSGLAYAKFFWYSQVAGALPDLLGRYAVALEFAAGGALLVTAAVLAGERWVARRGLAVTRSDS